MEPCAARWLGRRDYGEVYALQLALVDQRRRGEVPDTLLLCEHPDVITVGRRLRAEANIREARFPVHEIERGGDVTYHGPGQLVGYPILQLQPGEQDLHRYLRGLEEALMRLCADHGVATARREGFTGVWTADGARKIASLGIAVRRWVTFHGFALNVHTDLSRFGAINPCGLEARVMTSLARERGGEAPPLEALWEPAAAALCAVLGRRLIDDDAHPG